MKGKVASTLVTFYLVLFASQLCAQQSSFSWGFQERVRNTYMNNLNDYNSDKDDTKDFYRIRTNLWGQYKLGNLTAKLQLTNETRYFPISSNPAEEGEWKPNEIFIDNLFVSWAKDTWAVTVGRQNLIYGEGFVLLDGGPWDGSRAIYHDAVKISKKFGSTTVDLLGINNTKYDGWPLWSLEDGEMRHGTDNDLYKQVLNDGTERALGLYMVQNAANNARYDLYYFIKIEEPSPYLGAAVPDEDLTLNHIGGRVLYPLNPQTTIVAEGGLQLGSQGDMDVFAWGGYAYLNYKAGQKIGGVATLGVMALSGDDPTTADKYEGWNPMFARWPKWSELYIYSHIQEIDKGARKVAYWTNEFSPYASYKFNVTKQINVTGTFYHRRSMFGDVAKSTSDSKTRGNEIQVLAKATINKNWSAHFLYDLFMPGDFYPTDDSGVFIRGEVLYKF